MFIGFWMDSFVSRGRWVARLSLSAAGIFTGLMVNNRTAILNVLTSMALWVVLYNLLSLFFRWSYHLGHRRRARPPRTTGGQ